MQRKTPLVFETALPEAVRTTLADIRGAAWVIDLEKGRIAAATAEGARKLGLSLEMTDSAVKRAVAAPELTRLREFAHEVSVPGAKPASAELFKFRGAHDALTCEVSIPVQDDERAYVLVRPRGKSRGALAGVAKERSSNFAVRALSSELAHELRTPLGAIATAAEIMMDERFGPV